MGEGGGLQHQRLHILDAYLGKVQLDWVQNFLLTDLECLVDMEPPERDTLDIVKGNNQLLVAREAGVELDCVNHYPLRGLESDRHLGRKWKWNRSLWKVKRVWSEKGVLQEVNISEWHDVIKKKGLGITFDGVDEYLRWVDTREIKTDEEIHAAANHHPANLEEKGKLFIEESFLMDGGEFWMLDGGTN